MTGFLLPPLLPNSNAAIIDSRSNSAEIRWVAAMALGSVDDVLQEEAIRTLHILCKDPVAAVRAQAAQGLIEQCRCKPRNDLEWIYVLKSDQSAGVRCTVVDAALQLLDNPRDVILSLIKDDDSSVRMSAVAALGEIGDKSLLEHAKDLLEDNDKEVQVAAALSLASLGANDGESVLLNRLIAPSEDIIRALGLISCTKAVDSLRKLTEKWFTPMSIKASAAVSLYACIPGVSERQTICRFLKAKKLETVISILNALYRLPIKGFTAEVASLVTQKNEIIASAAIQTLSALNEVDHLAYKELLSLRDILDSPLAEEAAEALSNYT